MLLGLIGIESPAADNDSTPGQKSQGFHVRFNGYQQINGVYVFQFRFDDVAAKKQPPMKRIGDSLGWGGYFVGPFRQAFTREIDPLTHIQIVTDTSTLELDKPGTDQSVILPFRRMVKLMK